MTVYGRTVFEKYSPEYSEHLSLPCTLINKITIINQGRTPGLFISRGKRIQTILAPALSTNFSTCLACPLASRRSGLSFR